jgi:hypothetical protein
VWLSRNSERAWVGCVPGNTVATAMRAPNADTIFVGCANGTIFRFNFCRRRLVQRCGTDHAALAPGSAILRWTPPI